MFIVPHIPQCDTSDWCDYYSL